MILCLFFKPNKFVGFFVYAHNLQYIFRYLQLKLMKLQYKAGLLVSVFSLFLLMAAIAQNIPHPAWSRQSNIYEVNLRQYSPSGSVKDFEKHLSRLRNMGVEILWFMPVTPIGVEGRKMTSNDLGSYYAVKNYKAFNEELNNGGLESLCKTCS